MRRHHCLTCSLPVDTYFGIEKRRPQIGTPSLSTRLRSPRRPANVGVGPNFQRSARLANTQIGGPLVLGVVIATMSPIHALIAGAVHNPTALISSTTPPPPPPRNIHRDRHHVKQIYLSCGGGLSKGKRSQLQTLPVRRPSTNGPVLGPDRLEVDSRGDPMAPPRYV